MPAKPLLVLPKAEPSVLPQGPRKFPSLKLPTHAYQGQKFSPVFTRVQNAIQSGRAYELRADPASIAPERALVFELADSLDKFYEAVSKIPGLDFLSEGDVELSPDGDTFVHFDKRKGKEGELRLDKKIEGRLYVAMPDVAALREIVSIWGQWERTKALPHGLGAWKDVFIHLYKIRPWGPDDRIPQETIDYWKDKVRDDPGGYVRTEVELWYYTNPRKLEQAYSELLGILRECNGKVVDHANIPEIGYNGTLVDLPAREIETLIRKDNLRLATCDHIMYLRPQSTCLVPWESESVEVHDEYISQGVGGEPVAALLDGVPVERHRLLADRLRVDDPDDLAGRSIVGGRYHGTQMASLIIHGDRNLAGQPIRRPLYVRPVLHASGERRQEQPPADRLLIDLIFRAIQRMKEGDNEGDAVAPSVFIVNLSLGDTRRPFCGPMSPWGRALDYLAERYGLLFIVSAGNVCDPLSLAGFSGWAGFEDADQSEREEAVLRALFENKAYRTMYSPAEALNVITVGAWHEDAVTKPAGGRMVFPYGGAYLPNMSSALGLGHRKVVKPDIHLPGGREPVTFKQSGDGSLTIKPVTTPGRSFGIKAAMPSAQGSLSEEGLVAGTSPATALATRACHLIYDTLQDREGGSLHADLPARYNAVVVKALLIHRAQWGEKGEELGVLFGPSGQGKHVARLDNVARVLGFGRPRIEEAVECDGHRATLVGYGDISSNEAIVFNIPLPPCLEGVKEPRAIIVTLSWLSPVNSRHQAYRCAKLEAGPVGKLEYEVGVARAKDQPSDKSVPRGTNFHVRYTGDKAVAFLDDGYLKVRVFCKEKAGILDQPVRYGLAVTIEAGLGLPIYEQVRSRLAVPISVTPNA